MGCIFGVLTDTFHKQGFKMHVAIIAQIFRIIATNVVTTPLWESKQGNFQNNKQYISLVTMNLIANSFKNLTKAQVQNFVTGAFALCTDAKKMSIHTRDFLVQLKEFAKGDLYDEKKENAKMRKLAEQK